MVAFWELEQSSGEIIALDKLEAVPVLSGVAHWRRLCDGRRFPERDDIAPHRFGSLLEHMILVKVLDDGADYEYRLVGESLIPGLGESFAGRRLSRITRGAPKFGLGAKMLYDMVRASGEPLGYRGWVGRDMKGSQFVYHENALLPLGPDSHEVDHLLMVSMILPRAATGPA